MNYCKDFADLYKTTCSAKHQTSIFNKVSDVSLSGLHSIIDKAIGRATVFDNSVHGVVTFKDKLKKFKELVSKEDVEKSDIVDGLYFCRIDRNSFGSAVFDGFGKYNAVCKKNYFGGLQSHYSYSILDDYLRKGMSVLWEYVDGMVDE